MILRRLRDYLRARDEAKRRVSLVEVEDDTLTLGKLIWPVLFMLAVLIVGVFA